MDQPSLPARRRGLLLPALAVLAVAGSVFALTSLRADDQRTTSPEPAAQTAALPASVVDAQKAAVAQYSPAAETSAIAVEIKNYAFSRPASRCSPGATVTWTNEDTAPHTVTVSSGPVDLRVADLQQGQTFSYTFTKAGTYSYYCAVHPDMKASVTVQGSTPRPPPRPRGRRQPRRPPPR
ncbi:plastocyanin/azurin family copper-binding protein [Kutzneria kofuensis]|uniref:plastocyanin/azurin family copper-binding protein n=1 Tax=Kutzneria kofuensis TaxID=103725 RepID=UPI0031E64210